MADKIRVGLIRCDMHGAYFGALMAQHNPLKLERPGDPQRQKHYSWQSGGAHFYFYTHYAAPEQMTVEFVEGFELVKVWDEHRDAAENLAEVWEGNVQVCDHFEQISDGVDLVFIADCNGDGSDHLELATPGLEKGVPTFVDKPLAYDTAGARAIIALAQKHRAPLASISILRALPAAARFARRLDEVGGVEFGSIQGGGTQMAGHIHAASLALHLFGDGVEEVRCMGEMELQTVHLSYGERADRPRRGVALNCDVGVPWHCAFYASAYGPGGVAHSPSLSDFDFPFGAAEILKTVREMIKTGQSPAINRDMFAGVAITEAARLAQREGRAVRIEEMGENPWL